MMVHNEKKLDDLYVVLCMSILGNIYIFRRG